MSQLGNGGVAYRTHYGLPETAEKTEYPVQMEIQTDGCTVVICTRTQMTKAQLDMFLTVAMAHIMANRAKGVTTYTVVY